ncbi:Potassium-transporting ATPase potassium-binding subunit [Bienertia sinuspersici]
MKVQDQSSESLFSLSLDSKKHELETETEVNSPMLIKNSSPNDSNSDNLDIEYVDSILNPVENLTQWKFIKAKSKLASKDHQHHHQAKENIISSQNFSTSAKNEQVSEKDIGVDTSLSTWLGGSPKNNENDTSRSSSISVGNSPYDSSIQLLVHLENRQAKSPERCANHWQVLEVTGKHTEQTTDTGSSAKKVPKANIERVQRLSGIQHHLKQDWRKHLKRKVRVNRFWQCEGWLAVSQEL